MYIHTTPVAKEYYSLRDCVLWELLFLKLSNIGAQLNVFYIFFFIFWHVKQNKYFTYSLFIQCFTLILWLIYVLIWRCNETTATLQRLDDLEGLRFFCLCCRTFSIKKTIYISYIWWRFPLVFLCATCRLPYGYITIHKRLFNIRCLLTNVIFVRSGKIKKSAGPPLPVALAGVSVA